MDAVDFLLALGTKSMTAFVDKTCTNGLASDDFRKKKKPSRDRVLISLSSYRNFVLEKTVKITFRLGL